jgi:hypothetical protein
MAYKKYIQRNGKLYGPYIYHSKRVDGKVISEYYGNNVDKSNKYKKFLLIIGGSLLLAVLIYFIVFSGHKITGGVVMGIDTSYQAGKPLEGILKFSLMEGELIPQSSKVIFENSGNMQEFTLSDLVKESPSQGNYYVPGKDITGNGLGYGIEGAKTIYPEVGFTLQVYTESNTGGETVPVGVTPEVTESNTEGETVPVGVTPEVISNEDVQTSPVESTTTETTSSTIENSSSPITGNSVKSGGFFASIFGLTGKVTMNLENEVSGVVSKNKPFTYELKEGETVELKPKSININGEEQNDNLVSLKIENREVIVTTDYSENQKGYGLDYTGNKEKTISLDLSNLNLSLEQGDLTIKLVYNGEDIIQLSTLLKEGETASNEIVIAVNNSEEIPIQTNESNESIIETNQTTNENSNFSFIDIGNYLTSEERGILANKFGNITLETTKSELFKDRIIVGYNFNNYSIEYSYDSSLSKEVLDLQMENDRIKFLKDIVKAVSKKETTSTNIEGFNQSYNF